MEITPIVILIYLIIKDTIIQGREEESRIQIDRLETRLIRLDDKLAAIKKESEAQQPKKSADWRRYGSEVYQSFRDQKAKRI